MTNYYDLLNVSPDAPADVIDKAYRRAAQIFHPDKPDGSDEKMREINAARIVLMDREQRARYDASIHAGTALAPIIATVTKEELAKFMATARVDGEECDLCDGAKQVRVGAGGFWQRRTCPKCAEDE